MAMNKDTLGLSIKSKVDAALVGKQTTDADYAESMYTAMADAIIDHIKNFMEVTVPQSANSGITVVGSASVGSQGINPEQTIGPGTGIS